MGVNLLEARRWNIIAGQPHLETASGNLVTFSKGERAPMTACSSTIELKQDGEGNATPSNVRPLHGYTGLRVHCASSAPTNGVYSFNPIQSGSGTPSPTNVRTYSPGLTFTRDDNSTITAAGGTLNPATRVLTVDMGINTYTGASSESWNFGSNYPGMAYDKIIPTPKKSQYKGETRGGFNFMDTASRSPGLVSGTAVISWMGSMGVNTQNQSAISISSLDDWKTYISVHPFQVAYEYDTPQTYQLSDAEFSRALAALQINYDSSLITWPTAGTIYEGTVDLQNGILTTNYYLLEATPTAMPSLYYDSADAQAGIATFYINHGENNIPAVQAYVMISDRFSRWATGVGKHEQFTWGTYIKMPYDELSSINVAGARAWFADHPTIFLYKLAEPATYQLDSVATRSLRGINNIWSDTGAVSVSYWTY